MRTAQLQHPPTSQGTNSASFSGNFVTLYPLNWRAFLTVMPEGTFKLSSFNWIVVSSVILKNNFSII
jgi:hypothetical protein